MHRLAHDRVVRDLDGPGARVLLAAGERGEHRGHQVVGLHALDRRRRPPPAALPQHHERAAEVPAPPHLEHRRQEQRLREDVRGVLGGQELRHVLEREALPGAEGEHHRVVAGRGLELEVEPPAEALPERETEGAVDPAAVRRVDHELHPAGLVEEALEDDAALGREDAEGGARGREVAHDLGRDPGVDAGLGREADRGRGDVGRREALVERLAQAPTRRPTPPRCAPAPRRARRERSAARPRRRPRGRRRPRRGGSARTCSRGGTRRPACSRWPSPR